MTRKSPEQRILEELVRAARSDRVSDLDATRLEEQLRQCWGEQVNRERQRARATALFARWTPFALAAAVAVVADIAAVRHFAIRESVAVRSAGSNLDGDQLQLGRPIVSDALPLTVTHAGKATWTLAPRGSARVIALRPCLTLGLDAGRIDADVRPSTRAESFAIETRTHRIAVHGTRFSVEVNPNDVLVEVSSGAVVVTRRDHATPNTRSLLSAPQRLRFPLHEPSILPGVALPVPVNSATPNRARTLPTNLQPTTASAGEPTLAAELPLRPTALEQETALDVVRAAAVRCFVQTSTFDAESHSEVRVRVETRLTLSIAPDGTLRELSFMPPVPPEIAACTRGETREWTAPPSRLGADTSRSIILTK